MIKLLSVFLLIGCSSFGQMISGPAVNLAVTNLGNGSYAISGNGLPGYTYSIQFTEDLSQTNWETLGETNADSNGAFLFIDVSGLPQGFYRAAVSRNAAPAGPISMVANTAAFWNYRDAPIGNTSSWTDEVSSIVLTNWAAKANRPTNTGMGWYFYNAGFTNMGVLSNGAPLSAWIVFCDVLNPNRVQLAGNLNGSFNGISLYSSSSVKQQLDFFWNGSGHTATNLIGVVDSGDNDVTNQPLWTDLVYANGSVFLDGSPTTAGVGQPTTNMVWQAMGNDNNNDSLTGYIKYLLISTNHVITAAEASNLWVWEQTNGVTNVNGGLVAWYKCADPVNSSTLSDSSGNGCTLTTSGSPTWVGGLNAVVSNGIYFNGSSQLAEGIIPLSVNPFLATHQCTMTMWLTFVDTDRSGSWMKLTGGGNEFGFYKDSGYGIRCVCGSSGTDYTETGELNICNFTTNQAPNWHFVAFASDGTNFDVWIDGFRQNPLPILQTGANQLYGNGGGETHSNWWVGINNLSVCGANTTPYQNGTVTDMRIYDRILSDAEIDILYRSPTADAIIGQYLY